MKYYEDTILKIYLQNKNIIYIWNKIWNKVTENNNKFQTSTLFSLVPINCNYIFIHISEKYSTKMRLFEYTEWIFDWLQNIDD